MLKGYAVVLAAITLSGCRDHWSHETVPSDEIVINYDTALGNVNETTTVAWMGTGEIGMQWPPSPDGAAGRTVTYEGGMYEPCVRGCAAIATDQEWRTHALELDGGAVLEAAERCITKCRRCEP